MSYNVIRDDNSPCLFYNSTYKLQLDLYILAKNFPNSHEEEYKFIG